jgi:hypothetical protein
MDGFEYPIGPHIRRHGPEGYRDYNSYRDWLRDEFIFRCVYCLHREQWDIRGTPFHIEHFVPVIVDPDGECEYSNLLYACGPCNEAKKAILGLPNPCTINFYECLQIRADGHVNALNDNGEKLKKVLRLDSEQNVRKRFRWMRVLEALRLGNPDIYQELMGYPDDLPDLRKKHVSQNMKPQGAESCYHVLRERGELPPTY